jgi:hypothetical protein
VFEKLLSLLLHAKGGAVATVFVLGTTGALVTATVDAGVTTITITQPSSTTTGSETTGGSTTTNTTVTDTILALFTRTNADEDPTATATGEGCSDEAHERNDAMKDVNAASTTHRQEIKGLDRESDASDAKQLVKDADKDIRDIRQAAVKAIHATFDCDPNDDEDDVDENDADEDNTSTTTDPSVAFGGDNAEAIADLAILAMDQVVADLKAALEGLENSDETTTADEKQNGKSENAKNENKGKGNDNKGKGSGKGRSGGDEDDD